MRKGRPEIGEDYIKWKMKRLEQSAAEIKKLQPAANKGLSKAERNAVIDIARRMHDSPQLERGEIHRALSGFKHSLQELYQHAQSLVEALDATRLSHRPSRSTTRMGSIPVIHRRGVKK